VPVPGWDVVLTLADNDDEIVALSKTGGAELWRYSLAAYVVGVAADPASGRVLVVTEQATVVLALDTGEQVAVRPLPEELGYTDLARVGSPVGAVTVWASDDATGVIDVSSGETLTTIRHVSNDCAYSPGATASSLLMVSSGNGDDCDEHVVLRLGDVGRLERTAQVRPPSGAGGLVACQDRTFGTRYDHAGCGVAVEAAGDVAVASLGWNNPESAGEEPARRDLVALSAGGDVLWRASETLGTGALPEHATLVGVTDRRVIAVWGEQWHMLSLADGDEIAREPAEELRLRPYEGGNPPVDTPCGVEPDLYLAPVIDAERIYTQCGERLYIRRIDDLSLVGTPAWPAEAQALYPTAGLLVADFSHEGISAWGPQT
jgi:hypothetical protein